MSTENKTDEYYLYKAKKYHYKIQKKLLNMKQEGKTIPVDYEQYLQDFNMIGGDEHNLPAIITANQAVLQETVSNSLEEFTAITSQDLLSLQLEIQKLKEAYESIKTSHNASNTALHDKMNKDLKTILEILKHGKINLITEIGNLIERSKETEEKLIDSYIKKIQEQHNKYNEIFTESMRIIHKDIVTIGDTLSPPKNIPPSSTSN